MSKWTVLPIVIVLAVVLFNGHSAALPLAIKVVFGFEHRLIDGMMNQNVVNATGPSALMWAWKGPFIGALIRPIGGMMADKMGAGTTYKNRRE